MILKSQFLRGIFSPLATLPIVLSGLAIPAIAITNFSNQSLRPNSYLLAQEAITETVLFFETENFAVRIFRRGEALFMNLYNKQTGFTEVRETPAELVPSTRNWTTYRNTFGEANRYAKVGLNGESELEIIDPSDESTLVKESGYDTVVGVPNGETDFRGNNFAPGTGASITAPRYAELRQQPQPEADMIITIPRGDLVDVLDRVGNPADGFIWYQVLYNGSTGWVRGDTLTPA